jgi:hypothetical protein
MSIRSDENTGPGHAAGSVGLNFMRQSFAAAMTGGFSALPLSRKLKPG